VHMDLKRDNLDSQIVGSTRQRREDDPWNSPGLKTVLYCQYTLLEICVVQLLQKSPVPDHEIVLFNSSIWCCQCRRTATFRRLTHFQGRHRIGDLCCEGPQICI
jgi:hypothetical protein